MDIEHRVFLKVFSDSLQTVSEENVQDALKILECADDSCDHSHLSNYLIPWITNEDARAGIQDFATALISDLARKLAFVNPLVAEQLALVISCGADNCPGCDESFDKHRAKLFEPLFEMLSEMHAFAMTMGAILGTMAERNRNSEGDGK